MSRTRLLIAGIGNIFRGDDGFGVEVVRRLAGRPFAEGVVVRDFGIRGVDLAYALSEGYDAAILVDAMQRGRPAGTVSILEPTLPDAPGDGSRPLDPHATDPVRALELARALGHTPSVVRVVGCEPALLGDDDEPLLGLSPEVTAAIDPAVTTVLALVAEILSPSAGQRAPRSMEAL